MGLSARGGWGLALSGRLERSWLFRKRRHVWEEVEVLSRGLSSLRAYFLCPPDASKAHTCAEVCELRARHDHAWLWVRMPWIQLPGSGVPRVRDFGARQVSDSGLAFRFKITCSHDLSIHYPGGAAGSPNYCRKDAVGTPAEPTARGSDCMHLVES